MSKNSGFHGHQDRQVSHLDSSLLATHKLHTIHERTLTYRFATHFHPYSLELHRRLLTNSVRGLQDADTELGTQHFFKKRYRPSTSLVDTDYPVKDLDFEPDGAYSAYNWELFYHVPLTNGIHLSRNQRFAEAMQWFHYIFDPTDDSDGPEPQRFWKVKPFRTTDVQMIEEVLLNLATGADPKLQRLTMASIDAWRESPFRPHLVARYRPTSYMLKAVMAYLDNLIEWGDSLFRQDTGEAIGEATQLYVLAASILGPRPQTIPAKASVRRKTYANLKADLDEFGNAMVGMEVEIPFDLSGPPPQTPAGDRLSTLRSIGSSLYFCLPRNDKLMGYWDTVADRLFKIRNSLNLQGIFRQLALFDPPIDPALLARAAAAGLDIGAVVSGINQPLPLVRFSLLVQKAQEITQEVKSLGGALLSAIEKEDGERLALVRAQHEKRILELTKALRHGQWQEAVKSREGVETSLQNAIQRYAYYQSLLGNEIDAAELNQLEELEPSALDGGYGQGEPGGPIPEPLDPDIAPDPDAEAGGFKVNRREMEELQKLVAARDWERIGAGLAALGATFKSIPDFEIATKPFGTGGAIRWGGHNLGDASSIGGQVAHIIAGEWSYEAGMAGRLAGYQRRELDWGFQSNVAAGEIAATYKQLRAAQIREAVAEREYQNHLEQIKNSEDIELFLQGEKKLEGGKKTSTVALYAWMKREVRGLYSQCFQFAFDVARKAERALQHELGDPSKTFLQFGYTGGMEALLVGEKLHLDLKRMELAYHELNQREYELTKHVSLRQLNPAALLELRATGRCTVTLPEELFDMDGPGHYFRRIRNVAVTIPCVVGPYASVNCTLTLLKSSVRKSPMLGDGGYVRDGDDTERFSDHFGSLQGIVTSSGQNDAGLFETSLRDERYLPFEGSGAISEWQLEIPAEIPQFDLDTIADVVLHIRYTAREGGQLLRMGAVANLRTAIEQARTAGSVRLLSARHDFSTQWARFTGTPLENELKLELREEHYPIWARAVLPATDQVDPLTLHRVDVLILADENDTIGLKTVAGADIDVVYDERFAGFVGTLPGSQAAVEPLSVTLSGGTVHDVFFMLAWGGNPEEE